MVAIKKRHTVKHRTSRLHRKPAINQEKLEQLIKAKFIKKQQSAIETCKKYIKKSKTDTISQKIKLFISNFKKSALNTKLKNSIISLKKTVHIPKPTLPRRRRFHEYSSKITKHLNFFPNPIYNRYNSNNVLRNIVDADFISHYIDIRYIKNNEIVIRNAIRSTPHRFVGIEDLYNIVKCMIDNAPQSLYKKINALCCSIYHYCEVYLDNTFFDVNRFGNNTNLAENHYKNISITNDKNSRIVSLIMNYIYTFRLMSLDLMSNPDKAHEDTAKLREFHHNEYLKASNDDSRHYKVTISNIDQDIIFDDHLLCVYYPDMDYITNIDNIHTSISILSHQIRYLTYDYINTTQDKVTATIK